MQNYTVKQTPPNYILKQNVNVQGWFWKFFYINIIV